MMDSRSVQNMSSFYQNKFEKYCISLAFIIRIFQIRLPIHCIILEYMQVKSCYMLYKSFEYIFK